MNEDELNKKIWNEKFIIENYNFDMNWIQKQMIEAMVEKSSSLREHYDFIVAEQPDEMTELENEVARKYGLDKQEEDDDDDFELRGAL